MSCKYKPLPSHAEYVLKCMAYPITSFDSLTAATKHPKAGRLPNPSRSKTDEKIKKKKSEFTIKYKIANSIYF